MGKRLTLGIMFAKVVAAGLVLGAIFFMVYAARDHYHAEHACACVAKWELLPFIASGLAIIFALALLALKETEGAAAVVLPFVQEIRLGRNNNQDVTATVTTTTLDPAKPGEVAPALTPATDEDKK